MKKALAVAAAIAITGTAAAGHLFLQPSRSVSAEKLYPVSARGARPEAAATPAIETIEMRVGRIVEGLAAPDAAAREKAARELAALPVQARKALRTAARAADAGVEEMLLKRIEELNDQWALNPPPISLRVENATLVETIPALGAQLEGMAMGRMRANSLSVNQRYTLNVENMPFWDVIGELRRTGIGMGVDTLTGQLMFLESLRPDPTPRQYLVQGPFCFCVWMQPIPTAASAPPSTQIPTLRTILAIDPRMTLVEVEQRIEPLRDEEGNVLYTQSVTPFSELPPWEKYTSNTAYAQSLRLAVQEKTKKIPLMRVKVRVVVALSSVEADIPDVAQHVNEPVTLGTTTATITNFSTERQISTAFTATSEKVVPYVIFDLFDKNEKLIRRGTANKQASMGASLGESVGPFRAHLIAPQRVKEMEMVFQVKDVMVKP